MLIRFQAPFLLQSLRYTESKFDRPFLTMQTTLNLDENLLREALQLTNLIEQEELIHLALQELVKSRKKRNLLDLAGQIQLAPDFDHKALRQTRHAAD